MMAVQGGASVVVACESSEAMCQAAAATLADNAMESRVRLVNKWSHQLTVGEDLPCRWERAGREAGRVGWRDIELDTVGKCSTWIMNETQVRFN